MSHNPHRRSEEDDETSSRTFLLNKSPNQPANNNDNTLEGRGVPLYNCDGSAIRIMSSNDKDCGSCSRVVYRNEFLSTHPLQSEIKERVGFHGGGKKIPYVTGEGVIRCMNIAFGHDGWSSDVMMEKCIVEDYDTHKKRWTVGYKALVKITIHNNTNNATLPHHTDMGSGDGISEHKMTAHEKAMKSAVTDAMKRAARHFGERLGNALYEKKRFPTVKLSIPKTNIQALHDLYQHNQNTALGMYNLSSATTTTTKITYPNTSNSNTIINSNNTSSSKLNNSTSDNNIQHHLPPQQQQQQQQQYPGGANLSHSNHNNHLPNTNINISTDGSNKNNADYNNNNNNNRIILTKNKIKSDPSHSSSVARPNPTNNSNSGTVNMNHINKPSFCNPMSSSSSSYNDNDNSLTNNTNTNHNNNFINNSKNAQTNPNKYNTNMKVNVNINSNQRYNNNNNDTHNTTSKSSSIINSDKNNNMDSKIAQSSLFHSQKNDTINNSSSNRNNFNNNNIPTGNKLSSKPPDFHNVNCNNSNNNCFQRISFGQHINSNHHNINDTNSSPTLQGNHSRIYNSNRRINTNTMTTPTHTNSYNTSNRPSFITPTAKSSLNSNSFLTTKPPQATTTSIPTSSSTFPPPSCSLSPQGMPQSKRLNPHNNSNIYPFPSKRPHTNPPLITTNTSMNGSTTNNPYHR